MQYLYSQTDTVGWKCTCAWNSALPFPVFRSEAKRLDQEGCRWRLWAVQLLAKPSRRESRTACRSAGPTAPSRTAPGCRERCWSHRWKTPRPSNSSAQGQKTHNGSPQQGQGKEVRESLVTFFVGFSASDQREKVGNWSVLTGQTPSSLLSLRSFLSTDKPKPVRICCFRLEKVCLILSLAQMCHNCRNIVWNLGAANGSKLTFP